jgi:hypothetical protein
VGPEAGQTGQAVFELRQLDLEAPLVRRRATGEDIEDQSRAIDHFDVERALEVALLGGSQIVVNHDHVVADIVAPGLDLLELPFADVGAGQGMRELLGYRADDLDVDGFGEPCQLFQGVGGCPGLMLTLDGDQEGMFGWAVGGMWRAWNGNLLGIMSDGEGRFIVAPGNKGRDGDDRLRTAEQGDDRRHHFQLGVAHHEIGEPQVLSQRLELLGDPIDRTDENRRHVEHSFR